MSLRHPRSRVKAVAVAAAGLALVASAATAATAAPSGGGGDDCSGGTAAAPQIIPKPASLTVGSGTFRLCDNARIVVDKHDGSGARAVADALRAYLRPATGFDLPVVTDHARGGDIALALDLKSDPTGEGYQLNATTKNVTLDATTPHGLYNGIQTIRQLLPPWIASPTRQSVAWTIPAVQIADAPRYQYRGVMLDIARHYESPSAVKRLIDQAAAYKVNTFHLHLSDDQGFRIVINGFPNLATVGGQGSVGTGGRTVDPGGFWTQAQYKDVVAYAAAHFMTLMPEVDTPGHNNAIIMSEYGDTANPLLNGNPHDINCTTKNPPQWNFTGDVGYSALCPESENTYTILSAIISQLAAMSSSKYYDLGGDEVPTSVLTQDRYAALVNREGGIVNANNKTVMGWADISGPGTALAPGSVAEYWNPDSGSAPGTVTATDAVKKGMKIVMAPANHAYLDQKYAKGVPASLGLTWACNQGCDVDQFYNWDPSTYVTGVTDDNVIGVEGAMWAETVTNSSNIEYMIFPRLPALAELGWSPKVERTATSPAYADFLTRLAAQGGRWQAAGQNFYPTPKVPWRLDLAAGRPDVDHGEVSGTLAKLAAPGFNTGQVTVSVDWGDGSTTPGILSGAVATPSTVNGLYDVVSDHTYAHHGSHDVTVTTTAGAATATAHVTVRT
ncbi:MAG TPA: beta-N-acetylhexosaminidase [Jatrophihabitantaceae bacterium]